MKPRSVFERLDARLVREPVRSATTGDLCNNDTTTLAAVRAPRATVRASGARR
jgi:hypothetical protein